MISIPFHPHLKDRDGIITNSSRSPEVVTQGASSTPRRPHKPSVLEAWIDRDEGWFPVVAIQSCSLPDCLEIATSSLKTSTSRLWLQFSFPFRVDHAGGQGHPPSTSQPTHQSTRSSRSSRSQHYSRGHQGFTSCHLACSFLVTTPSHTQRSLQHRARHS